MLYVLFNYAIYRVIPADEVRSLIDSESFYLGTEVAKRLLGGFGGVIVIIGMTISQLGSINGMAIAFPRTYYAMAAEGRPFKGIIFFGLMLTPDGPKVLEYNARFGDPEAQVVLPRMKNDIIEVMEACVNGTLDQIDLQFEDNAAVCVVLASDGYPVKYEKGIPMYGFENFKGKDGYYCFHAGTKLKDGQIVTNGGRVLGITATGKDLKEARKNAYEATEWITFANKYMRHDIGKAIDEA